MGDAGVLVELWRGGGGWLVCAGIAYMLLHRFSPSIVAYINAKTSRERRMAEAVDKVLQWPEQLNHSFHELKSSFHDLKNETSRRLEDHTDAINHIATVLEIQPRVKRPRTKEINPHE